jgi:acyl-CoA synthetase (NDP forming)
MELGEMRKTMSVARLLRPRSVAIVGASPTPGALGASVLGNLERAGYAGDIHLVNPKRAEINGRPCVASVEALPDGVDCAVLAIPRAAVLETIEACAKKGVGGAILFAAGFAEGGDQGRAEQERIAEIAREAGMVVEGPNCLGLVNYVDGTPLTFVETAPLRLGDREGIAIVSQSGAMAVVLAAGLTGRDLGLSYSVSTGNEAASGVEDYVEFLLDDPGTRVIALIVEQFRKPKRFLELARKARALGKWIVLLHPGRSSAARASAATHTGAMAGDYAVMRLKVAEAGVVAVESLEELIDVTELLLRSAVLPGPGTAVLTESGAFKALTLDLCEQIDLALPPLTADTTAKLRAVLPDFIGTSNPMDITAQALVDPDLYNRTLSVLAEDDSYGCIVLGIILTDPATCQLKLPPITEAVRKLDGKKSVVFAALDEGAVVPPELIDGLRAIGVPFFLSPERAFRAIGRLTSSLAPPVEQKVAKGSSLPPLTPGVIPEYRSKELLAELGIPLPEGGFARTPAEAIDVAKRIGYPVVLKAQSPDLSHKSDAGGVILNLADEAAVTAGWARLHANIAGHRPGLVLDGVLVEGMGARGTELIVGARNDPDWGPVVLVGFGGVTAELFHDARLISPALDRAGIEAELHKLKSSALLRGFRGAPALDVSAAADIVAKIAALVASRPEIAEIDVNPVVVYPEGAVALDALMVVT